MTRHDALIRLRLMRDYGERAIAIGRGKSADEIANDELLSLAIPKALELVGEAAAQVPGEFRQRYPEIDWRRLVAFRNILVHAYELADFPIIVDVLNDHLPDLLEHVRRAIAAEEVQEE